jgi:alkanesulfonate monooxygenase SsuD/methylene tetrahydromethanopterin reductase-like flavin-dependent oxidoreductase (luciferase family)
VFLMRFDMRSAAGPDARPELYQAAVEMSAWAEGKGCLAVVLSEHHSSSDGYVPSPLILGSAIAARTQSLPIQVAALLPVFHDPIRLAEDITVLDIMSKGRVSYVLGLGYRPEEFAMFGVPMKGRGREMEKRVGALVRALSGEAFEYDGRAVHVTPSPLTPGGPLMYIGGSTPAAARRAARCDMGLYAQSGDPSLEPIYRDECEKLGIKPKSCMIPPDGLVMSAFVAEDPDRAWAELGPYMLHDAKMYASWLGDSTAAVKNVASTVEELRADPGPFRIFTPDEAIDYIKANGVLITQPLSGGIPPEAAWPSLELIADKVLPALA